MCFIVLLKGAGRKNRITLFSTDPLSERTVAAQKGFRHGSSIGPADRSTMSSEVFGALSTALENPEQTYSHP